MVELLNSSHKNNSEKNTHCFASIEGGDKEAVELLELIAKSMRHLMDHGLVLKDVLVNIGGEQD